MISRLANLAILLSQYDMPFVSQKVVKRQALPDFFAAHLVLEISKLHVNISDKVTEGNITSEDNVWQMFFEGASRTGPIGKIILEWG